jgi:prephenate dehydrogenase
MHARTRDRTAVAHTLQLGTVLLLAHLCLLCLGLVAEQMPDEEKRKRATFVVQSDVDMSELSAQVNQVVQAIATKQQERLHQLPGSSLEQ